MVRPEPPAPRPQRIGLYGGAFDPPHLAHVALARAAIDQLDLDVLHILPTGQAWHKTRQLTVSAHRLAMTQLAFEGEPHCLVDAQEIERQGPSYTIDTLETLKGRYAALAAQTPPDWFLIIGQDQAKALHTWKRWQEVCQIATVCIADRAVESLAGTSFDANLDLPVAAVRIALPSMPHSSTEIRARAASGHSIATLVPEPVARYIANHQLYPHTPA